MTDKNMISFVTFTTVKIQLLQTQAIAKNRLNTLKYAQCIYKCKQDKTR